MIDINGIILRTLRPTHCAIVSQTDPDVRLAILIDIDSDDDFTVRSAIRNIESIIYLEIDSILLARK